MKNLGVTLAFTSHLLSPTMSDSEIGGEPAIRGIYLKSLKEKKKKRKEKKVFRFLVAKIYTNISSWHQSIRILCELSSCQVYSKLPSALADCIG